MKTLYININNEEIQSVEELVVLPHRLDIDMLFYIGEEIANGCRIEDERKLITDFNILGNENEYKQFIEQMDELKFILFGNECIGCFEFKLPAKYLDWLKYSSEWYDIYTKNFSNGKSSVTIDLKELYDASAKNLQKEILRKLERDDLYLEIDEIVFNDDAVTRKSPIVHTIKEKYDGIGFKSYKKWLQENEEEPQTTSKVCEKCKKNSCECEQYEDSLFPIDGITLGKTSINEVDKDELDDHEISITYNTAKGVVFGGFLNGNNYFVFATTEHKKMPTKWKEHLGFDLGCKYEKCERLLLNNGYELKNRHEFYATFLSPNKLYLVELSLDCLLKLDSILIFLNKCPHCGLNDLEMRDDECPICKNCGKAYLEVDEDVTVETNNKEIETPNCPNCSSDDVDDDGSNYLQYTCNDCGHNWGHDDTIECPECGSDDVENDGTNNLQYECNTCGHMWGDCEYDDSDDDTDNAGNQMSEYYEAFGFIVGKSTKYDIQRQGGVLVNPDSGYGEHQMPNGIEVFFFNNSYTVNHITIHNKASNSIPYFYKNLGIYWGINKIEFRSIFENLGFTVREYKSEYTDEISAYKECTKFNKCITITIHYYALGMFSFNVS